MREQHAAVPAMNQRQPPHTASRNGDTSYLPDFCNARMAFGVVLIAELVALLLALARPDASLGFWTELARISLLLLWIALGTAAALCGARSWLHRLPLAQGSILALALMVLIPIAVTEAAYWIGWLFMQRTGAASSALFPDRHADLLLRTAGISAIVGGLVLRYFYVASQWRRNVQSQARSRIDALQARIRPHFLFNSMNTIASLTRTQPALAEEAVEDLADLFRATLSEESHQITLKQELEVARIYQRIEALRLGERLQVRWDIGMLPPRALVPSLLIQPLLENAIYHGIEALPQGGVIRITGHMEGSTIGLSVSNPMAHAGARARDGNRMALENIRQRLELAYEGQARMEVLQEAETFTVSLRFPYTENRLESAHR